MGAGDHHLEHVHPEQHDHRLRAEMMQAADQPAEIHLVLDEINARPGSTVPGTVRRHEQHAGDELDSKHEGERATPDIAPLGPAGNMLDEQDGDQRTAAGAAVEPGG